VNYRLPALLAALLLAASPALSAETDNPEELIKVWGCRACHRIKDFGGSLASDLNRVGQHLNAIDIRLKLHPLPGQNQGALMPTYPEMSDEEVRIISVYLAGFK